MTDFVSLREAARRIGVSETAVRKAIKANRIKVEHFDSMNGRPLLVWPDVLEEWKRNSSEEKRSHVGSRGAPDRKDDWAQSLQVAERMGEPVDSNHQDAPAKRGPGRPPKPKPEKPEIEIPDDEDLPSYAVSRAKREYHMAELARLEAEEKAGKLVDINLVHQSAFKVHRQVRDAMLNIPDRCSAQLSALREPIEVHSFLLREINEALRLLANDIYLTNEA